MSLEIIFRNTYLLEYTENFLKIIFVRTHFLWEIKCIHLSRSSSYCCCSFPKLCLTVCDPMDCSLPGSSVHGILQARILEWAAISFSRGSSQSRGWTDVSCIGRRTAESPENIGTYGVQRNKSLISIKIHIEIRENLGRHLPKGLFTQFLNGW